MDTSNNNFCKISTDQFYSESKNVNQVWTKENFNCFKENGDKKSYLRSNLSLDLSALKTTWSIKNSDEQKSTDEDSDDSQLKIDNKEVRSPTLSIPEKEVVLSSHHARRPMNAFLIFCKKHRPVVRQRYPHLENRGVTRILGEWWALLDESEKQSYTTLAKEYKDAFFSANPDFKWYKLPAPPLRSLVNRPLGVQTPISPLASPTQLTPNAAVFTPGKLADETQLGNLTSLMNINNNHSNNNDNNNDNNNFYNSRTFLSDNNKWEFHEHRSNYITDNFLNTKGKCQQVTPNVGIDVLIPSKPVKKRFFEPIKCSQAIVRNIFNASQNPIDNFGTIMYPVNEHENLTRQELMDKVVDSMFPENDSNINVQNDSNENLMERRKSLRSCKGKRYAEFMMEGKLFGSKQTKRTDYEIDEKFESALINKIEDTLHNKSETETPKLSLNDNIKCSAEHTRANLEDIYDIDGEEDISDGLISNKDNKRKRTESENSEESFAKLHADFNLDLRINGLPSLNYDIFMQRKRASKKRKYYRSKSESSVLQTKVLMLSKTDNAAIGSKKRKNKHNITRLEKPDFDNKYSPNYNNDLFGLATLAEVAANTEKINSLL